MRRSAAGVAAGMSLALLAACDEPVRGGEPTETEVYVLVDLSRTWFNPESAEHNREVLESVGAGAAMVADGVKPPYLVQHRAIGDNAFLRTPICSVVYMPGFRRNQVGDERQTRQRNVETYLTRTCVDVILAKPPEPLTQISAAIASVAAEPKPRATSRRSVIVLSDFLEESQSVAEIPDGSLKDIDVLLLYRPLREDQANPAAAVARVASWRALLESKGGKVEVAPDTSVRASQIVSFLKP